MNKKKVSGKTIMNIYKAIYRPNISRDKIPKRSERRKNSFNYQQTGIN